MYVNVHINPCSYIDKIYMSHTYIYMKYVYALKSREYFYYCTVAIESKYFKRCKQNFKKMYPYNNGIFDVTINRLKHSSVTIASQVSA